MQGSALTRIGLPIAIMIVMCGIGMSLTPTGFRRIGERPKPVLIGCRATASGCRCSDSASPGCSSCGCNLPMHAPALLLVVIGRCVLRNVAIGPSSADQGLPG